MVTKKLTSPYDVLHTIYILVLVCAVSNRKNGPGFRREFLLEQGCVPHLSNSSGSIAFVVLSRSRMSLLPRKGGGI